MIKITLIRIKDYLRKVKGQGLLEYAVMIGLIAMVLISLVGSIGKEVYEFVAAALLEVTKIKS